MKSTAESMSELSVATIELTIGNSLAKVEKGGWRMPRLTEAMKDVISCDKRGVGANNH